jgi:hypothetical protein
MLAAIAQRVAAGQTVSFVQISNNRGRVNGWTSLDRINGMIFAPEME